MDGIDIAKLAAHAADEKSGTNIIIYDLHGISDIADYFVIVTVQSKIQARAVITHIEKTLKDRGVKCHGREGHNDSAWTLIDYVDTVVHVFSSELREYYSLESLWGDAPRIEWQTNPPPQASGNKPAADE